MHKYLIYIFFKYLGYDIKKSQVDLDSISCKTKYEFEKWHINKRWDIVNFHYYNNDFYYDKIGSNIPDNWDELPIIKKEDIQNNLKKSISRPYREIKNYKANTSGSTGIPLYFIKDKKCHARSWAAIFNLYQIHNIYPGSKEARFYGMPEDFIGMLIEKVKDFICNRKRFVVFNLSNNKLDQFIKRFSKDQYVYIYGYTHSIFLFAEYLIKKKIILNQICPSLKKVIITSELCTENEKKIIELATGVNVVVEYGASECSIIAIDCEKGSLHINESNLFVENNEKGEILITDLFNKAMPFIRYKIGDLGNITRSFCECSLSKYSIVHNLNGRINDLICLPSGKIAPGLTFFYISRSILEKESSVKEFRVIQQSLNSFKFLIVSKNNLLESTKQEIKNITSSYLEPGLKIEFKICDRIERKYSDKIQHFFSELK